MRNPTRLYLIVLSALLASCADPVLGPGVGRTPLDGPAFTLVGPVTDISAGEYHSCAIGAGAAVSCWGFAGIDIGDRIESFQDREIELNCTSTSDCRVPQPSGMFTQVSAGTRHTCALRVDGSIGCWGYNLFGQIDAPGGSFTQVSAGEWHTCAVDIDATVRCWGRNESGQTDAPSGSFTHVDAGEFHTCAIDTSGSIRCWGIDPDLTNAPGGSFTQVSAGTSKTCAVGTGGAISCWGYGQASIPSGSFIEVSAGAAHACALATDGAIRCWGDNSRGQINAPSGSFVKVSAGGGHTCAIRADGTPECWGSSQWNQATLQGAGFVQVGADNNLTCGLRSNGAITCWGEGPQISGTFTQLGSGYSPMCALGTDGAITCWGSATLATPAPSGRFTRVSSGFWFGCAIRPDSTISCWGFNENGQTDAPSGTFTDVSAGHNHACAIRSTDGTIACWGGQSGFIPPFQHYAPPGSFTQVSAGSFDTCAISTTGEVRCWGFRGPVDAPSGSFTYVSNGGTHTCAIGTDAAIRCWGSNNYGQADAPSGSFIHVSTGWNHTCGVRTDSTVECWGGPASTSFVTTANEAPLVAGITLPDAPVPLGSASSISAVFSDRNPGDVHTATIDWGDGTSSAGIVTEANGAGTIQGSHTYSATGIFTVLMTASDGQLEGSRSSTSDTPASIVVYDPDAGFVTGSGWIDSPPGACSWSGCAADGTTMGRLTFDFVAKYQKAEATPSGAAAIQFRAGALEFESRSHDWLIVSGARAQFQGTGTINDAGDYVILVSMVDGNRSGGGADRVRIKVWDRATGVLAYDSEPGVLADAEPVTSLRGGSIVLHRPKK